MTSENYSDNSTSLIHIDSKTVQFGENYFHTHQRNYLEMVESYHLLDCTTDLLDPLFQDVLG